MPLADNHLADKFLVSLTLTVCLASSAFGATITGNVTGPDGKPFMGAFVVAENAQNKMTVNVLSDQQGRYHIGSLPAATYTVKITAIGYQGDPRTDGRSSGDPGFGRHDRRDGAGGIQEGNRHRRRRGPIDGRFRSTGG